MEDYDYLLFLKRLKNKIAEFEFKFDVYNAYTTVSLFDGSALIDRNSYIGKLRRLHRENVFSVEQIRELYKLISSKDEQARKLGMGIIDGRVLAKKKSKKVL
jgi:hypothetical protein